MKISNTDLLSDALASAHEMKTEMTMKQVKVGNTLTDGIMSFIRCQCLEDKQKWWGNH